MRRSERDARLARLTERLFQSAFEVLLVGTALPLSSRRLHHVGELALLAPSSSFDAAFVRLEVGLEVRSQVARVRTQLRPGASLLLTTPARASAAQRARALMTRVPPVLLPLEALCEALLGLGLVTPRAHDELPDQLLVSASLPRTPSALDVFFEQPTVSARR